MQALTTRLIAVQLVLGPRTADAHVCATFRNLAVPARGGDRGLDWPRMTQWKGWGRTMPYLLIQQRVTDYRQWKASFDADGVTRQTHGSRGGQLFRSASDPNELAVLLEWDVLDKARQYAQSEDFHELMQRAGVVGRCSIAFLKDGEQVAR